MPRIDPDSCLFRALQQPVRHKSSSDLEPKISTAALPLRWKQRHGFAPSAKVSVKSQIRHPGAGSICGLCRLETLAPVQSAPLLSARHPLCLQKQVRRLVGVSSP